MIADKLARVHERIASACASAGRPVESVTLLVVSKTFGPDAVRAAFSEGETRFGENYVQEGLEKVLSLGDVRERIEWHLIGPLQSNKTRVVAENFDWVHSVDRERIATRLAEQRPPDRAPLKVLLQVRLGNEPGKAGIDPDALPPLAAAVSALPRLELRGLMCMPEPATVEAAQRAPFRRLRELLLDLNRRGHSLDTLSMGMSGDLEAAIAEGATIVRVGTAIFGPRT